jgi:predicted XRE-type DNA-binding protein
MSISDDIKKLKRKHPHWGAARIAEELGVTRSYVSVAATRKKIKFMTRRQLEDLIDGKKK